MLLAQEPVAAPEVHAAFHNNPELLQWVTGVPDQRTLATFKHWARQLQVPITEHPPPPLDGG